MFSNDIKTDCTLWLAEFKSPTKVERMLRAKYGRNAETPARSQILRWHAMFKKNHSFSAEKKRTPTVDRELVVQNYERNPKQSLRRMANNLNVCHSSVSVALKKAGYKNYRPQIVQALKENDLIARVSFANFILDKINGSSPNFMQTILFSDEAIFHLEGGVNRHNCSHWSTSNPHWIVEKSLNTPRIMVWAAVGAPGIIGPLFFEGNVNADSYLEMLTEHVYPKLLTLPNASNVLFMQDGAPPHWAQRVREWLNETFPDRWIGRGGPGDTNINWPARSPDLTPMDFFVWGFIKSKVYDRNYQNFDDLKAAITTAFGLITEEMVVSTLRNLQKRLKLVVERSGRHVEH